MRLDQDLSFMRIIPSHFAPQDADIAHVAAAIHRVDVHVHLFHHPGVSRVAMTPTQSIQNDFEALTQTKFLGVCSRSSFACLDNLTS